jgi:hypothetical protein
VVHYAFVTGLQGLVTFAFYVAVLVFVLSRRTRLGPQAARPAVTGVGLLLAGWLFSALWPTLYGAYSSQFEAGPDFPIAASLFGFVSGAVHLAGIALLLMALFAERPAAPTTWPAPYPHAAGPGDDRPGNGGTAAPGGIPPWAGTDER